MYKVQAKVLVNKDGKFLLSKGRADILELIEETGSIAETARRMKMSYRHIWGVLKKIEARAGRKLVESSSGGSSGGRTGLTRAGKELLEFYHEADRWLNRAARYGPKPALTVDGIVMLKGKLVLVKRGRDPFKGMWALPGGFVEYGEVLEDAVVREIREETNMSTSVVSLLGVYSSPDRDPRHHTVSAVYVLKKSGGELRAGDDAGEADLFPLSRLPELAFDHSDIVSDFVKWKKGQ